MKVLADLVQEADACRRGDPVVVELEPYGVRAFGVQTAGGVILQAFDAAGYLVLRFIRTFG